MLDLRQRNKLKTEQAATTYCICRRIRSGKMVLCQLCLDLFHGQIFVNPEWSFLVCCQSNRRCARWWFYTLCSKNDRFYFCYNLCTVLFLNNPMWAMVPNASQKHCRFWCCIDLLCVCLFHHLLPVASCNFFLFVSCLYFSFLFSFLLSALKSGPNFVAVAVCVKYVEPEAPDSADDDTLLDLQQLYFCPKCVRSHRPSLELLSTLTCSTQSFMVTLPEVAAAETLRRRAACWRDNVQKLLQSDEVRDVRNELAEIRLMGRIAMRDTAYIFQRGIYYFAYIITLSAGWINGAAPVGKSCEKGRHSVELEL